MPKQRSMQVKVKLKDRERHTAHNLKYITPIHWKVQKRSRSHGLQPDNRETKKPIQLEAQNKDSHIAHNRRIQRSKKPAQLTS